MRLDLRVTTYRVAEAAQILGVSDDTVRRWIDAGRLEAISVDGRRAIDGAHLAQTASRLAESGDRPGTATSSARNHLPGIVTAVTRDTVMAQVELMCGPYRVVSLMSREAADELGLEPGVRAVASVKSTNVVIEKP